MDIRSLLIGMLTLCALVPAGARADDYTDLVKMVTQGPPESHPVRQMIAGVEGRTPQGHRKHKVGTRLGLIASTMTEGATLDAVATGMVVAGALSSTARRPQGMLKKGIRPNYARTFNATTLSTAAFVRPVPGRVTSSFGYRPAFGRNHSGIDLHLRTGDTVRAAMSGVVDKVSFEAGGYGNYVVITHPDGIETRYAHLLRSLVTPGEYVAAGEAIALGGNTGNSTGPHLHFETRMMGAAVNPATLFDYVTTAPEMQRYSERSVQQQQQAEFRTGFRAARVSLSGHSTYVVTAGDTPASVAARAGLSLRRLCSLNMLSPSDPLEPGRMLRLR